MDGELTLHSLEDVITHWLKAKLLLTNSMRTASAYQEVIMHFRSYLQRHDLDLDSPVQDIVPKTLDWLATPQHQSKKQLSAGTFNQRRAILSSFYTFAIRQGYFTQANPMQRIDPKRNAARRATQGVTIETMKQNLLAIDQSTLVGLRDFALIEFAAMTGKRAHELIALDIGDLHAQSDGVLIAWRTLKGGDMQERLYEYPHAANLLRYLVARHGPEWPSLPKGTPVWSALSYNAGKRMTRNGLAYIYSRRIGTTKVHDTRRIFAQTMFRVGASAPQVQQLMGHKTLAPTQRYTEEAQTTTNPFTGKMGKLLGLAADEQKED